MREDWISIARVCTRLGLVTEAQIRRLRASRWARTTLLPQPDTRGRTRATWCVRAEDVPLWLATVCTARARRDLRERIEAYQRDARDLLAAAAAVRG